MTVETILAIFALAIAGTWSPGPNNAMLASSGARFGFRASFPHAMGVALGFPVMCFVMALGLGQIFVAQPLLGEVLRYVGAGMLLWIAWKTLNAKPPGTEQGSAKPWTFWQASAFQWVNPKAWVMAISMISQFVTGAAPLREAALVSGVFLLSGLTSANSWAGFGAALQRFLSTRARMMVFNVVMAGLIVLTVFGLLFADLRLQ